MINMIFSIFHFSCVLTVLTAFEESSITSQFVNDAAVLEIFRSHKLSCYDGSYIVRTRGKDTGVIATLNLKFTLNETSSSNPKKKVSKSCTIVDESQLDHSNKGYRLSPGIGWHRIFTNEISWFGARQRCKIDGGHLAIPDSDQEREVLLDLVRAMNVSAWIGIHGLFHQHWYTTLLDKTVDNPCPSKYRPVRHCVDLKFDGEYECHECSDEKPYLCEIPLYS